MDTTTDSFYVIGEKIKLYKKIREELNELVTPKLYVCTQCRSSIVAIYDFYAETLKEDMNIISADHNGKRTWQILGMYKTKERMLQIYNEMLQHSKANPDEVYQMPKE